MYIQFQHSKEILFYEFIEESHLGLVTPPGFHLLTNFIKTSTKLKWTKLVLGNYGIGWLQSTKRGDFHLSADYCARADILEFGFNIFSCCSQGTHSLRCLHIFRSVKNWKSSLCLLPWGTNQLPLFHSAQAAHGTLRALCAIWILLIFYSWKVECSKLAR